MCSGFGWTPVPFFFLREKAYDVVISFMPQFQQLFCRFYLAILERLKLTLFTVKARAGFVQFGRCSRQLEQHPEALGGGSENWNDERNSETTHAHAHTRE